MKKILIAFKPFIVETTHDLMAFACIIGPILAGAAFRFLIPSLEKELCEYYGKTQIISPYYAIFDMLIIVMAPIMFCFAGVMVILDEMDYGVAKYYVITPLGKRGYLIARVVLPCIISFFYDIVLVKLFSISQMSLGMLLALTAGGCILAIDTAMLVVSFANNKMEGIALVKLCGILILGIPVPYFVTDSVKYLFSVLPSFWMAQLCTSGKYICCIPMIITGVIIMELLYKRFSHKLI